MDPPRLVVVLGLNVGKIRIVREIGILRELGIVRDIGIHGKIKRVIEVVVDPLIWRLRPMATVEAATLPPRKRDRLTSLHPVATIEAMAVLGSVSDPFKVSSTSALQVLRRLGSIFTSVYAAKLKHVVSLLEGLQGGKKIALCQKE
ncbi:hypothetical protein Tco_0273297 [Tanacetum coccineum]